MVDPADVVTAGTIAQSGDEMTVMLHEYKAGVEAYLATRPSAAEQPRTVAEIVAFNRDHEADELALFGQDILIAASRSVIWTIPPTWRPAHVISEGHAKTGSTLPCKGRGPRYSPSRQWARPGASTT